MKKFILLAFLFLAGNLLYAQVSTRDSIKKETISPKKFKKLAKKKNTVVIDVRTSNEYAAGHIPNSKQIDVEKADFDDQVKNLDRSKTYLLYCRSGRRSENAANKMKAMGFTKVYHLQGGIENWKGKIEQ